jgi:O-antigen biosynthesis protein
LLTRLPSSRRFGLRRIRGSQWLATDGDPQFFFSFLRLLPFPYVVFQLKGADRLLDPCVYIDRGKGFDQSEALEFRPTRDGIYIVALKTLGNVRRLRFDPSSCPSQFEFRAFAGFNLHSVKAFVGSRLRDAGREGGALPKCETIAEGDLGGPLEFGLRARKGRSVTDHFDEVLALAAARYSHPVERHGDDPLISFVCPVFNTPVDYLDQLLNSFSIQQKGAWELILIDDASTSHETIAWLDEHRGCAALKFVRCARNSGIAAATNSGLAAARGTWVGFIDHDDALTPFAVDRLVETIEQNPAARFIYTDEVVVNRKLRPAAFFLKPAYDPVLLSGMNYINHLSLYRRDRLAEIGGLRLGFDGSQDYDLLLRYLAGLNAAQVLHLPYPAYLWRRDGRSHSITFLDQALRNARRALSEAYTKSDVDAPVEPALHPNLHRVRFDATIRSWPKISIVIPNRDSFELLSRLLDDIIRRTDYPHLEIIIPDNGSKDPRILSLYEKMRASVSGFRAEILEEPFNFARQVNRGIGMATGEHVLLLNNDIEVTDPGWLKEMVSCLAYPNTGIVGARLIYPNGTLQHVGVIVGLGGVAGHWFCGERGSHPGPMARLMVRQTFSAVTGASMLISKDCRAVTGDFDEKTFAIAYNDIDYCLRAGEQGFRTVWTPFATLIHHESASRGSDETKDNKSRFDREKQSLRTKYGLESYVDKAFNPWYGRNKSTPSLGSVERLPEPR